MEKWCNARNVESPIDALPGLTGDSDTVTYFYLQSKRRQLTECAAKNRQIQREKKEIEFTGQNMWTLEDPH